MGPLDWIWTSLGLDHSLYRLSLVLGGNTAKATLFPARGPALGCLAG